MQAVTQQTYAIKQSACPQIATVTPFELPLAKLEEIKSSIFQKQAVFATFIENDLSKLQFNAAHQRLQDKVQASQK